MEQKDGFIPRGTILKQELDQPNIATKTPAEKVVSLSLSNLSSAQSVAMAMLPAPAAASLQEVWSVLDGAEDSRAQLLDLLGQGTLGQKDGDLTVAEHLHSLTEKPRASGFSGTVLTKQTIALLAEPEKSVFQGEKRYTCGAANMQHQLSESPALLARIVDELSDPEGSLEAVPGVELERPIHAEADDGSGRNSINRLLQGALMNVAAGESNGPYDALTDRFANGEAALESRQIAQVTADLTGHDQTVVLHDSGTSKEFHRLFKSLPKDQTFQVGAYWEEQDHMLLCLGQEDGQVEFFNPQTSKTDSMPVDDFLFKTQLAIFPAQFLDGFEFPEDAAYLSEAKKR
jgi:hypothetical protein